MPTTEPSSDSDTQDAPIRVAAVIPVFNRRETTLQGLRSLSRVDLTGIDLRIFIVDDASTDGTAEAIESEFPEVVIVRGNGNLHYAGGTNAGMTAARDWHPHHYLLTNDDSLFHDQFLQRLLETAAKNPRSVVGALLLLWDQPHRVFQVGQKWSTSHGGWVIPEDLTAFNVGSEPFDVECVVGNCTLLPADAVSECGLMDAERFPHGWGDAQYFMRMRKAGWRLMVNPRAYVWCEPNTYPAPLHTLGVREILRVLFVNERHPLNLKRQLVARLHSSPGGWLQATAAFAVYCGQLLKKALFTRR